jgi:hypothetical protein
VPLPGNFGRFTSSVFGNALGYGVGSAMGPIITPPVQDIANELWQLHPVLPLDPALAAQIAIKDPELFDAMQREAKMSGFNSDRFANIVHAIDTPPGADAMLELFRRGDIDHNKLIAGLRSALIEDAWLEEYVKLFRYMLSPAELAAMRQQQFITQEEHHTRAKEQGVLPADAELQYEIAGLPPGIGEAIELLRRGHIDEGRFAQIVAEGHTKTKYTQDLLHLRRQPLSASIAAEALVRERVTQTKALEIAKENGLDPDDFMLYSNMLGRPIAPGQAQDAVNRELVGPIGSAQSKAFFREVVARSDVRTEYADILYQLRITYPSLFQMRTLIENGAIDDDYARQILQAEGYEAKLAEGIITGAHSTKQAKTKDLSQSMIMELYEGGFESEDWAKGALVALGYDEDEAQLLINLIDARRVFAALKSQLNVIHRAYVNHKSSRDRAIEQLDAFGIGDVARDLLVESWDAERDANVTRLTNSQIGSALHKAIITKEDAITRWMQNGYPQEDADVLAELATHTAPPSNPVPA